ncbi:MAG: class I SAM-dependent methyltransferase [Planctomycetes bacterium]|nr:class I SAM-dependent methyltransferase [Planctomycetota bacterium]
MHPLAALKQILIDARYEQDALVPLTTATPAGHGVDPTALERLVAAPTRVNALARLFYFGRALSTQAADEALAPLGSAPLVEAGLLTSKDGSVRSTCVLASVLGTIICRDFESWVTGRPLGHDYVLGVGLASRLLNDFTVRVKARLALDIGTGQGFQALRAAAHCERVIATDINARALRLAGIAMQINSVTNVELREGSLFEPVVAEKGTFDLIISNPPFVISPPHDISAIGGRWEGDEFVRELVQGIPEYLAPGGYATVLCDWHHPTVDAWKDRVCSWLEGRGVDAWIQKLKTDDARTYATRWLREASSALGEAEISKSLEHLPAWLAYYERLGIGAVSMGSIIMRKRAPAPGAPANFIRADAPGIDGGGGPASDQALRMFRNELALRSAPNEDALLDLRLGVSPDAELQQRCGVSGGAWRPRSSVLRESSGAEFPVSLDSLTSTVLAKLNPAKTARESIHELAKQVGADPAIAMKQTAPFLAKMLRLTHVEVVGGDTAS